MSAVYKVIPMTMCDAVFIARHMRDQDKKEMLALGKSPDDAVMGALGSEFAFSAHADDVPFYIFGMSRSTILSPVGRVWGMGTDALSRHARTFWPNSKNFIEFCRKRASVLESDVDMRNTLSVRWLKRLGFEFDEPAPIGKDGKLFCRVSMKGEFYV